ncbi:protein tyrosine kinase domain-containing protein [Ditylenchus destructor]|uniref:receptor protein-tyrosine kinase n=1 Tax=Ditylenchus destructor TaxID=166010 RepID=A0AAD4MWD9_9BILA|nr:protein tyrosine kinase domain-containing protein [Ditylenchus destructor]
MANGFRNAKNAYAKLLRDPMTPAILQCHTMVLYGLMLIHETVYGFSLKKDLHLMATSFILALLATALAVIPCRGRSVFMLPFIPLILWRLFAIIGLKDANYNTSRDLEESGSKVPLLACNELAGFTQMGCPSDSQQNQDGRKSSTSPVSSTLTESPTNLCTPMTNDQFFGRIQNEIATSGYPCGGSLTETISCSKGEPLVLVMQDFPGTSSSFNAEQSSPYRLKQLKRLNEIDSGHFGSVWLAEYSDRIGTRNVAVKTIEGVNFHETMLEVGIISRCDHENIVQCYGYEYNGKKCNIIFEFLSGGNLERKLKEWKQSMNVLRAVDYLRQVCSGMEYLADKGIIHRDLAARNCLLSGDFCTIKVADFGLSRLSDRNQEYVPINRRRLPFRWTAIECFVPKGRFTEKSDVWSFGILAWQMLSDGATPYESMDLDGLIQLLYSGERLECPLRCPEDLYDDIMLPCWEHLPEIRPSFAQLQGLLLDLEAAYREAMFSVMTRRCSF